MLWQKKKKRKKATKPKAVTLVAPLTNKDSTENYWFTPMYFSPIWTTRRLFGRC